MPLDSPVSYGCGGTGGKLALKIVLDVFDLGVGTLVVIRTARRDGLDRHHGKNHLLVPPAARRLVLVFREIPSQAVRLVRNDPAFSQLVLDVVRVVSEKARLIARLHVRNAHARDREPLCRAFAVSHCRLLLKDCSLGPSSWRPATSRWL